MPRSSPCVIAFLALAAISRAWAEDTPPTLTSKAAMISPDQVDRAAWPGCAPAQLPLLLPRKFNNKIGLIGKTIVTFDVSAEGRSSNHVVVRSVGDRPMDEEVVRMLAQCPFHPATESGRPVASHSSLEYRWVLE